MNQILEVALERLASLWEAAVVVWRAGGWAMIAIALIALVLFAVGLRVYLELRRTGFRSVPEKTWRRWIEHPEERRGPIGDVMSSVAGAKTVDEAAELFERLRAVELGPYSRDLRVMKVCVSAAPLVGLLGTVTGMLTTFGALASGSGGNKTMDLVSGGISEALITTETGLVIALAGLFFQYQLVRTFERYTAFLAHLETVWTQALYLRRRREGATRLDRAALEELARRLRRRVGVGNGRPEPAYATASQRAPAHAALSRELLTEGSKP
jgi:biopolymer transport protein ExbB